MKTQLVGLGAFLCHAATVRLKSQQKSVVATCTPLDKRKGSLQSPRSPLERHEKQRFKSPSQSWARKARTKSRRAVTVWGWWFILRSDWKLSGKNKIFLDKISSMYEFFQFYAQHLLTCLNTKVRFTVHANLKKSSNWQSNLQLKTVNFQDQYTQQHSLGTRGHIHKAT